ncbi:MAG TPA: hypothetical protein VFX30_08140 [bacterium]|nr:hypothetical protein [bacterium]
MPGRLPFSDKEARFLKELAKHKVRFMIVGLSAANLQGAPVVTQDIDLWFQDLSDPKIRKALNKIGGIYVPPFGGNPPMFTGDDMALFDIVLTMSGLKGFREEVKNTVDIPLGPYKIKALSLERIIASKKAARRKKDLITLPVLEDTLRTLRERKENGKFSK